MKEKQSRLEKITIPSYTKGEEIFNMSSHIVGVALGITVTVLCIVRAAMHQNVYGIVGGAIFGATMIILYCMSSIYHGLSPRINAKKVFRVLDHCAIYLLVAGTYTPIALCTIREYNTALGWTLFGIIWGLAILGTTLTAINVEKTKILEVVLYLGMGWSVLFAKNALAEGLGKGGLILFITGGVAYSVGAVLYLLGKKHEYIHSIFHLFILAGSLLHFLGIFFYVL
jgi:channel protein, hemolysin III family